MNKSKLIIIGLIIIAICSYFLAINIVNGISVYIQFFLTVLCFIILLFLAKSIVVDILFLPFDKTKFKYVKSKFLMFKFKIQFLFNKILFSIGLILLSYFLTYTLLNIVIFFVSHNSVIKSETVRINDLDISRKSFDYEFYFKNSLVSKRTEMNEINRAILDGKDSLENYRIIVKYKESCFDSYYILEKKFVPR